MIINSSRAKLAKTCWRKTFNLYHRLAGGQKTSSLVDGTAFHKGVAVGLATKDWEEGLKQARVSYDQEALTSNIPPEQGYLLEDHWDLVKEMVLLYKQHYEEEEYTILQPECEFDVALPGEKHHCIWLHWYDVEEDKEIWGPPPADKILRHAVAYPKHDLGDIHSQHEPCPCFTHHRLAGRTDAVVKWQGNIWLVDHKTSAIQGQQFWDGFELDLQPTAYIWGIWKSIGLRPRGFVINHIFRPSEAQVANWNSKRKSGSGKTEKDYLKYERQPFLRSEEDLWRFEHDIVDLCNEWERRIVEGKFPMEQTQGACLSYNRRCDYFGACKAHDNPNEFIPFGVKTPDYVDVKLEDLWKKR